MNLLSSLRLGCWMCFVIRQLLLSRPLMCFHNETLELFGWAFKLHWFYHPRCLWGYAAVQCFSRRKLTKSVSVPVSVVWRDIQMQRILVGEVHYSTVPLHICICVKQHMNDVGDKSMLLGFLWRRWGRRVERKTTAEQLQTTAPFSPAANPPSSIIHPFLHCIIYSSAFPSESWTPQHMHSML